MIAPVFAAVTFDWGTITLKDLVYALIGLGALVLGYRKVWAWYYQLEDCRTSYEAQLEQCRNAFRVQMDTARTDWQAQLTQARADFRLQIEAAEARAEGWRLLVYDGRALVKSSVETTARLAERHAP